MGGNPPLGYDLPVDDTRALVVNEDEAASVRALFRAYLDLGSVHALQRWAQERGIRTKQRTTNNGCPMGGRPLYRGALYRLLRNRLYLGQIVHGNEIHDGLHEQIVDAALFEDVQAKLDANARRHASGEDRLARAPLTGRLFDGRGERMSPTSTRGKRGQLYRYYVSASLQRGAQRNDDTALRRIAGPALEAMIATVMRRVAPAHAGDPLDLPLRIEVREESLQMLLPMDLLGSVRGHLDTGESAEPEPGDAKVFRLTIPVRLRLRGGRTWIIGGTAPAARRDPVLIRALRAAHTLVRTDKQGLPMLEVAPTSPYHRRLVRLAFLAPDLQRAILAGQQPLGLILESLMRRPIPIDWADQAAMFEALGVSGAKGANTSARH